MNLESPQLNRQTRLNLGVCVFLTGVSYLLTPLIIRTLADGVIPTKDFSAITSLICIVVFIEFFGTGASFIFKSHLEHSFRESIFEMRKYLLNQLARHRTLVNFSYVKRVIERDVFDLNFHLIKRKWNDYQDAFLVLLLISAAVLINFRFGFLILGIVVLNQMIHWTVKTLIRANYSDTRHFESDESNLIDGWLTNLKALWDHLEANSRLNPLLKTLDQIKEFYIKNSRLNSIGDALSRGLKMLAIAAAILVISADPDTVQSPGTIFALVVIIYRMTGPLGRLGKSVLTGQGGFDSFTKIRLLFEEFESPHSLQTTKFKAVFSHLRKLKLTKEPCSFFVGKKGAAKWGDLLRTFQMVYFREEPFYFSHDPDYKKLPQSVVQVVESDLQLNELRYSNVDATAFSCLWQVGFPFIGSTCLRNAFLIEENDEKTFTLSPIIYQGQPTQTSLDKLFSIWCTWSDQIRLLERDLERAFKTHTPCVVWILGRQDLEKLSTLKKRIRVFDFLIPLLRGYKVAVFFGTDLDGFEKIKKRLADLVDVSATVSENIVFFPNKGDCRIDLAKAKRLLVSQYLISLQGPIEERKAA